ncbi:MAG: hypothetical protein HQL86_05010 [Magnetococcales bacterium]|nr:hypothetical protein [Magnetococcales bacterium]
MGLVCRLEMGYSLARMILSGQRVSGGLIEGSVSCGAGLLGCGSICLMHWMADVDGCGCDAGVQWGACFCAFFLTNYYLNDQLFYFFKYIIFELNNLLNLLIRNIDKICARSKGINFLSNVRKCIDPTIGTVICCNAEGINAIQTVLFFQSRDLPINSTY